MRSNAFIISLLVLFAGLICFFCIHQKNDVLDLNIEALSRNESPGILKDCYDDPGQYALIEYLYYYKCDGCEKIRFYYGEGEKKSYFHQ